MIKSNGLRIENYVSVFGNISIVSEILENKIGVKSDCGTPCEIDYYDYNEIEPIPITEEILLKCGFSKFKGDNSDCFLNDFETSCNMELLFWKGTEIKNIKHLHQLQNLYFALTGKEIEIKF